MKRFNKILTILAILVTVFVYANMAKAAGETYTTRGLVSYWTLDEADIDGKTATDWVGPNDGNIIGNPKSVPGKVGEAMEFDGATLIDCGRDESINMGSAVTLESWVWWENDTYVTVIGRDYSYVNYIKNSGTTRIATQTTAFKWGGHPVDPNYNIVPETWTHVVATYEDGEGAKLYINGAYWGKRPADNNPEGDLVVSDDPFTIGGGCMGGKFMTGLIDEVRLYNVALTPDEIKQNFESTAIRGQAVESFGKLAETWGKIKTSK